MSLSDGANGISRRDAIKKAAIAGGAAGIVWSAPKIEGLTLRPDYAAASTAGGAPQAWTVNGNKDSGSIAVPINAGSGFGLNASEQNVKIEAGLITAVIKGNSFGPTFGFNIEAIDPGALGAYIDQKNNSNELTAKRVVTGGVDNLPGGITVGGNFICT